MARVTVEDCLDKVDNHFELVLLATRRARQLSLGHEPKLEWENDKPTVMALREIADNVINREIMEEEEARKRETEADLEREIGEALRAVDVDEDDDVAEPTAEAAGEADAAADDTGAAAGEDSAGSETLEAGADDVQPQADADDDTGDASAPDSSDEENL